MRVPLHQYGDRPRIAVVTGAGGGLGAAIVKRLESRGYQALGFDVAGDCRRLDVTDAEACRSVARALRPAVWVNNAGLLGAGDAATQPDCEVEQVVRVNLLGVMNGTRAAVEVMRELGEGRVLNVGSLACWTPVPGEAVYAATKAGVLAFSASLAAELRDTEVTISVLCPDGMWSPMLHDRLDDPAAALSFTGTRLLQPDEVAAAAIDLLESARFVRTLPRWRGAQTRLIGALPGIGLRGYPVFRRLGLRNQRRFREQLADDVARIEQREEPG